LFEILITFNKLDKKGMILDDIIRAIKSNYIRITDHADEEAYDDKLSFDEIFYSVIKGEIIKEYENDRPYPSCLIYGENFRGEQNS
jgi:hypothetical protein